MSGTSDGGGGGGQGKGQGSDLLNRAKENTTEYKNPMSMSFRQYRLVRRPTHADITLSVTLKNKRRVYMSTGTDRQKPREGGRRREEEEGGGREGGG